LVSAQTILIIGGIVLFLVAGGGSLVRPALEQGRKDLSQIKGSVTEQVKNIKGTLKRNEENMI